MKHLWERINEQVDFAPSFTVKCKECKSEFMVVDCIAGNLFIEQDYMHCIVCGGFVSLREDRRAATDWMVLPNEEVGGRAA